MRNKEFITAKGNKPNRCKYCKNILSVRNKSGICNICIRASGKERMKRRK